MSTILGRDLPVLPNNHGPQTDRLIYKLGPFQGYDSGNATSREVGLYDQAFVDTYIHNLSNGGPVLVWGLDAMALTFVAAHSLHARPLVIPRSRELSVWNRTEDGDATVIVDGQQVGALRPGDRLDVKLGERKSLLATLPDRTFFTRYRDTFTS